MLKDLETGLIYRNPHPEVRSVHAYFPSVAPLPGGGMIGVLALGEAFEAVNLHAYVARSADGAAWELGERLDSGVPGRLTSDCGRLTVLPSGEVVVLLHRHDRTGHQGEGLANPVTLGFVPTEFALRRSVDGGRTFGPAEPLVPPLVGPSFELCSPIVPLADGRWLLPTSTWRGWDGDEPNGMKAVALISGDQGKTWPTHIDVMADPAHRVIFWESKIAELSPGRLIALAWAYNEEAGRDLPNHYALSNDAGATWGEPRSTGLFGQTMDVLPLAPDHLLAVYRRTDRPGLWAQLVRLQAGEWVNEAAAPIWGHQAAGLTASGANMVSNFHSLRFGAPCLRRLADGSIYLAFWCYEDYVSNIRWCRFRLEGV